MSSSSSEPRVRVRDLVRGVIRWAPRSPRVAHALLTVARADGSAAISMGALVERNARRHRHEPALLFEDRRWTWRELNLDANRCAHALAGLGVGPGHTVVLLLESRPALLLAAIALAKLGAAAGFVNTSLRGTSLAHSIRVTGARRVLVGEELAGPFEEVRAALDVAAPLYVVDPAGGATCPEGWTDLRALTRDAPYGNPASTGEVTLGDRLFTIPTSGTTGLPKASVMSHMRWLKAADTAGRILLDLRPGDVVYVPLPFFHNMALSIGWGAVVVAGAAMLMRRTFSVSAFWGDCRTHGVVAFPYIGELPRYLLNAPERPDDAQNPVRAIVGVGMRAGLWGPFARRFGVDDVFEIYSASEANTAFVNPFGIEGTVGFSPSPHALLAWDPGRGAPLRDRRGRYVRAKRGEPGLLIAKVSDRYRYDGYTDPTATEDKLLRDVFRAGDAWFDTGDLLRKVGWGHAVFVDRVGDTFRWRSENVSTLQVEQALGEFAAVGDCAVYGVEVPGAPGRAGMAALVLREGEGLDVAALSAHLFATLQEPAVPVFLRVLAELATTATFKNRKVDLREQGFDPAEGEAVYVRLPRARTWTPLDPDTLASLRAGSVVF